MTGRSVGSGLRLLMAVTVVAAIITQLANTISLGNSVVNFFSFFTIQSNIIGRHRDHHRCPGRSGRQGQCVAQSAPRRGDAVHGHHRNDLQPAAVSGADVQTPIPWVNSTLHYVFPLFIVIDWLVDRSVRPLSFRQGLIFLAYPVAYGVYTPGPRPDRRLVPVPVPRSAAPTATSIVAVMMVVVAIVGLALAWLLCWTSRWDFGRREEPAAAVAPVAEPARRAGAHPDSRRWRSGCAGPTIPDPPTGPMRSNVAT